MYGARHPLSAYDISGAASAACRYLRCTWGFTVTPTLVPQLSKHPGISPGVPTIPWRCFSSLPIPSYPPLYPPSASPTVISLLFILRSTIPQTHMSTITPPLLTPLASSSCRSSYPRSCSILRSRSPWGLTLTLAPPPPPPPLPPPSPNPRLFFFFFVTGFLEFMNVESGVERFSVHLSLFVCMPVPCCGCIGSIGL